MMMLDDLAKAERVEANLRLVVSIAKNYETARPFLDRVEDGNVGLMKAVESYVPTMAEVRRSERPTYLEMFSGKEVEVDDRFEAYAAPFIHDEIDRGIRDGVTAESRSSLDRALLARLVHLRALVARS